MTWSRHTPQSGIFHTFFFYGYPNGLLNVNCKWNIMETNIYRVFASNLQISRKHPVYILLLIFTSVTVVSGLLTLF